MLLLVFFGWTTTLYLTADAALSIKSATRIGSDRQQPTLRLHRSSTETAAAGFRLPVDLVPVHYDLYIGTHMGDDRHGAGDGGDGDGDNQFDADIFRFSGHVEIVVGKFCIHIITGDNFMQNVYITSSQFHCRCDTNRIVLHSRHLSIDSVELTSGGWAGGAGGSPIAVHSISTDVERDFLVINLTQTLRADAAAAAASLNNGYRLRIAFSADDLPVDTAQGYYRTSYNSGDRKSWLSVTQFETIYARRAFPCFDEPALKATFNVSLGHRSGWLALSNTPVLRQSECTNQSDWICDHFEQTIRLPTYLVAFSLHRLRSRQLLVTATAQPILLRAWTQTSYIADTEYALQLAARVLIELESYLGTPLPCRKIDLLAVPDFPFAGMENWGLVTFAERALLYTPGQSTTEDRHLIAIVMAHELTHQWFGNLVTLDWWSELWLNEAFASHLENRLIVWADGDCWSRVHQLDGYPSVLTNRAETDNALLLGGLRRGDEAELDDSAWSVYSKGAAVLRMAERIVGKDVFQRALQRYLRAHVYGNVRHTDWWFVLADELAGGNETIAKVFYDAMMYWTTEKGLPLLRVVRNFKLGTIELTQQEFSLDAENEIESQSCWTTPLSIATPNKAFSFGTHWLHCNDSKLIQHDSFRQPHYILLNVNLTVPYRVDYDRRNWQLLLSHLSSARFREIPPQNRAQLMDDLFEFAWWFHRLPERAVKDRLLRWLQQEDEYWVWTVALSHLQSLRQELTNNKLRASFEDFVRDAIAPVFKKVRFLDAELLFKNLELAQLQEVIVNHACDFQLVDCEKFALGMMYSWMNQTAPNERNVVPLNIRAAIYCHALRLGNEKISDFLVERARNITAVHEKYRLIEAFACSRDDSRNLVITDRSEAKTIAHRKDGFASSQQQQQQKSRGRPQTTTTPYNNLLIRKRARKFWHLKYN